jgi:glycosyltransferase involved in cell wall biosynthesis
MLNNLIASLPKFVDLTNTGHLQLIEETVRQILETIPEMEKIIDLEKELINRNDKSLIFILLALKIAKSKRIVAKIKGDMIVSIIFAVYKEHNRIKTKNEHPHGEDFLRKKVAQLEGLFGDHPNIKWELVVVDDGCPENSGKIAQKIIKKEQLDDKVKVLFLKEAIRQNLAITKPLASAGESQKGGAILYGMWDAIQRTQGENHIVFYTDADLSTHLGQVGLLLDPLLNKNKSVAIGSRREKDSIVIKEGKRNDRGKLFIYLWKRLILNIGEIIDTQCGFKAFKKEMAEKIITDMTEKKFAFDIELLLKAELEQKNTVAKVGVAWIDSEAASTTSDLQPYLPMLKAIVKMQQKYFPGNKKAKAFAQFIEALDEESFNKLVDNIPQEILKREPAAFGAFDAVGVDDLKLN